MIQTILIINQNDKKRQTVIEYTETVKHVKISRRKIFQELEELHYIVKGDRTLLKFHKGTSGGFLNCSKRDAVPLAARAITAVFFIVHSIRF